MTENTGMAFWIGLGRPDDHMCCREIDLPEEPERRDVASCKLRTDAAGCPLILDIRGSDVTCTGTDRIRYVRVGNVLCSWQRA